MAFNLTIPQVRDTVFTYFNDKWDNLTPIKYDNIDSDINYTEDWLRISLMVNNPDLSAIGQTYFRMRGIIFIQLFTLSNNGLSNNDEYTNKIIEEMTQVELENNVNLQESEINNTGISQDTNGLYFQTNISIKFYYDTRRITGV